MRVSRPKYNVGIDIGGTSIKLCIVDNKGQIVGEKLVQKTLANIPGKAFLELLVHMLDKKLSIISKNEINSIGIGVPGWVHKGKVISCANLPYFSNVELTKEMKRLTGIDTYAINDAKAAALAEYEHRKSSERMLYFIIGTGIGGAYIDKNGKLFESDNGFNFEVGHIITHYGRDAKQCGCGKKGCFEAHASSIALEKMANENFGWEKSGEEIYNLAKEGNETAKKLVDWQSEELAIGIANVSAIIDCQQIVVGGAVSQSLDFTKLQDRINGLSLSKSIQYSIEKAEVPDGGILGASALYKQYDKLKDFTRSAKRLLD